MQELAAELEYEGVVDLFDSLCGDANRYTYFADISRRFDTNISNLMRLLYLGEIVAPNPAWEVRHERLLFLLKQCGLLYRSEKGLSLGGLALYRYRGVWVFADAPQVSPVLYYGLDSIGLASRLKAIPGASALDLCSGPGIQALILAASGMRVTSVDINPLASRLCRINSKINGLDERVSIKTADLYDGIEEKYAMIIANPPLLPIPGGVPYPFIGNGGVDGLDLTTRIIQGAGRRLIQTGSLLMIGMTVLDRESVAQVEPIEHALEQAGLNGLMTILNSYETLPGSDWVAGVASTSFCHAPVRYRNPSAAQLEVAKAYKQAGIEGVCTYVLRAWHEGERPQKRLRVVNYSGIDDVDGPWLL
ncbi:MAG: methyltransferase [Coriobacteriaceae bacterium]|nr:methyltransferase [Coriobacteriaceae bacterium]